MAPTDVNLDNNAIPTTSGPISPSTGSYWQGGSYSAEGDTAILNTIANLSVETPNNIRAIRIGSNGSGTLQVGNPAELRATSTSNGVTQIGNGSGNVTALSSVLLRAESADSRSLVLIPGRLELAPTAVLVEPGPRIRAQS